MAAAGIVSTRALLPGVILAALFWPIRWLVTGRLSVRTAGDWAVGGLVLLLPVTLWATALPEVTQPQVLRLALGLALYYAVVNWATTAGRIRLLANGLVGAGLLLALSAPLMVQWGAGKLPFIPQALYTRLSLPTGEQVNANVLGGALAFLWPLALAWLLAPAGRLRWAERALALAATALVAVVLVLTQSRGD